MGLGPAPGCRNTGSRRITAASFRLTIGLGPRFAVGVNCDIAVETQPAKNGTVVSRGRTDHADGMARPLGGVGAKRFVYSDRQGHWHTRIEIGMRTFKGFVLGHLDGLPVHAPIDGVVRGIVRNSTSVPAGVKLLESTHADATPNGPASTTAAARSRKPL